MDRDTWALTLDLLAAVDDDADLRVAALAHVGAAVLLFERFDPAMAEALMVTVERLTESAKHRKMS